MTGAEIREMVLRKGFRLWQVAKKLGLSDNVFSRRLRDSFNDEEVERVKKALAELEDERNK